MKKALTAMAAVMLLGGVGFATDAAAQDRREEHRAERQAREQTQQQAEQPGEMTGKVLSVHERTIYLEGAQGEAVPIRVTHETTLNGERLRRDSRIEHRLREDFQPGEEVRTSFEPHREREGRYENRAVSVEKSQGGELQQPPPQVEQPQMGQ